MQTLFYNLSGGISQSQSKTAMGLETKKLYWTDAENIEILQNSGIIRQNGNTRLFTLPDNDEIITLHQMKDIDSYNLLVATKSGKLYVYSTKSLTLTELDKKIDSSVPLFCVEYLDGIVCGSEKDSLFYINNDVGFAVESCNLLDSLGAPIMVNAIGIYSGRIWVASKATLYYSALGKYNDFTSENDAGYINNFYTNTDDICALKTYQDYLAIYKESSVYLLSGSNNDDFKITPFADKGTASAFGVVTVNNKQYFINDGVFSLEQAGLLRQIQLGAEISIPIQKEFNQFDKTRFSKLIVLHYANKHQAWFFLPYQNDEYFHTIWIFDYVSEAWFKRVVPQNITFACLCNGSILTADSSGNVYKEDFGKTFDGQPIKFLWKSPFLASGNSNVRKTIEEFYFILDEDYDNDFQFSVYKDYDAEYKDDGDKIYSSNSTNLLWHNDSLNSNRNYCWPVELVNKSASMSKPVLWSTGADSIYKAEISESNYAVQLCVEGSSIEHNVAIIGLEFKEIYTDE